MSKALLSLDNVTVGYGDKEIISSINSSVSENELVAILGQNGAGKSTLINSILGFNEILKGKIFLEGELVNTISLQDMARRISVVLPKLSFVPRIKVIDLVSMGRLPYQKRLKKKSKEEQILIDEAFRLIGIEDLKYLFATEISEGQLQLALLARALCQDTKLIVLDEPTSNLDLANQYRIFNLLQKLKSETAKSFLMITHQIDLALGNADKIWWIEDKKLFEDIPEELAFRKQIIQKLSDQNLTFNHTNNCFSEREQYMKSISINGNSELAYWVKKAFNRHGYSVENSETSSIEITENNIIFEGKKFENIQSIVTFIQQNEKHNYNRGK